MTVAPARRSREPGGHAGDLDVRPLTPERWPDLVDLFGPRGGGHSCWCMTWRLPNSVYVGNDNEQNREALSDIVRSGRPTGVLGYRDRQAIAWCSVSPRPTMQRVVRSRALALDDVEDTAVWSVVCFFVRGGFRGQGLQAALLDGAIAHAHASGARRVEAYPMLPRGGDRGDVYTGTPELYARAGFEQIGQATTGRRIIMSLALTE